MILTQKNGGEWSDGISICSYDELRNSYDNYIIVMTVAINNAVLIRKMLEEKREEHLIVHMQCPFKVDDCLLEEDDSVFELENLFADETSKSIFQDYLYYKSTGDMERLIKYLDGDSFFDTKIIEKRKKHTYVDVGCYTGDTISKFLMFCDNSYQQIIGMEAEPGISKQASLFLELGRIRNAQIVNKGGWSERRIMEFQTIKDIEHTHFDSPNLFKSPREILGVRDNVKKEQTIYETIQIECDSIDNLFSDIHPTLIKINALAADLPILKGALNVLRNDRPYIIFDYGARPSYVRETLEVLVKNCVNYKFYLRQKEIFGDYKTVLYAVPK